MRLTTEQAQARLAGEVHGVLVTLHAQRGPVPQPVVYAVTPTIGGPDTASDGAAYMGVPIDSVKPKTSNRLQREANLAADPRASLLVEHWETWNWERLWWVRAQLEHVPDPPASLTDDLADRLARAVPHYAEKPFHRILVCRIVGLTGWAAADEG